MRMNQEQVNSLYGRRVHDRTGTKVGNIGNVWADAAGEPSWISVKTGLFGRRESMVPLQNVKMGQDDLTVPYDKDMVTNAPHVEASVDEPLKTDEIGQLYAYYGINQGPQPDGRTTATGREEMTRSEERLRVGKESQPAGTARLRKYVVSENVHTTVPIEHDEVWVEREPVTADARGGTRPEIGEAEREMVLTAERPVVSKERVPVERVRMSEDRVTEEQSIDEPVRRERIEAEMPENRRRGRR
ncbi:PRC and DUF2382 domain-containing protein [Plantactinospora sonchi]|uniref:PRC and DUF2382 domain-containing protein n=1 Tax=Plantactinospora sonchi TaxID=1544735 RepID=A0ABU7RY23_9ACTN